ncbi:hypothetical protein E2C01_090874 [Portunus trituberculatus]|uniref:Uncharacterized protein n=1 Tax=Portunus trituberculatus TaxID=210409 RepID=A0A5B7JTK5_PORTR|nr:hypothetical protein [Portunus trituberculatus]
MILEKLQSEPEDKQPHPTDSSTIPPPPSIPDQQDTYASHEDNAESENLDLMHITNEIKIIKSKLATKDMKIDLLNTEVKTAYHTIEQLQQRVTELEQRHCDNGDQWTPTYAPSPDPTYTAAAG